MATATTPRGYRYQDTLVGTPNNPVLHIQQLAEDVDSDIGPVDVNWTNLTLAGSWAVADSRPPAYKRRHGVVYLRGRVTAGSGTGTVATLPSGFRPSQTSSFPVASGVSAYASITSAGALTVTPGSTFMAFDGISFPVD